MTNLYHVFYKMPALSKQDMYVELEGLAWQLVNSGLLRIDAEPKQNFVRFSIPTRNVHINFSKRELYEEHLYQRTYDSIYKALKESGQSKNLESKVNAEIEKLKGQLKKHIEVEPEIEMELARILVQSCHPVVMSMILLEHVQVFVSYGYNIGEVMDVVSWQQAGTNSGMQSTDGKNVAIFVSCGGDPLLLDPVITEEEKNKQETTPQEKKTSGDGTPALARMMGIAGQEIGHYSDIRRTQYGQQVSRSSANFNATEANPRVNLARKTDMQNINIYFGLLDKIGLSRLIDQEKRVQFFRRNPNKPLSYYFKVLWLKILRLIFVFRANRIKFWPVSEIKKEEFLGEALQALLADMLFNLEPVADVYSNPDRNIEEAIACIEALARVPQQVNKWGHQNTLFLWRNLYKFYYYKVIPKCIEEYENISGKKFTAYPNKLHKYSFFEKLKIRFVEWKKQKSKI